MLGSSGLSFRVGVGSDASRDPVGTLHCSPGERKPDPWRGSARVSWAGCARGEPAPSVASGPPVCPSSRHKPGVCEPRSRAGDVNRTVCTVTEIFASFLGRDSPGGFWSWTGAVRKTAEQRRWLCRRSLPVSRFSLGPSLLAVEGGRVRVEEPEESKDAQGTD